MKTSFIRFCFLVASLLFSVQTDSPKLKIISTQLFSEFKQTDEILFKVAPYGDSPYGLNFEGVLLFSDDCELIPTLYDGYTTSYEGMSFILVLKKNHICHSNWESVIERIQSNGAILLIIIDDDEQPTFPILDENFNISIGVRENGEVHLRFIKLLMPFPIISIPKKEGEALISFIKKFSQPHFWRDLPFPKVNINFPDEEINEEIVSLDFWYSARDLESYEILKETLSFVRNESLFKFTPHFFTWDLDGNNSADLAFDEEDCISKGQFCAPDPDGEDFRTGQNTLFEDLKQAIYWRRNQYWSYIDDLKTEDLLRYHSCISIIFNRNLKWPTALALESFTLDDLCYDIEGSFIKSESSNPGIEVKTEVNRILKREKGLQLRYGVTKPLTLLINREPFLGDLTNRSALIEAIMSKSKHPSRIIEYFETMEANQRQLSQRKFKEEVLAISFKLGTGLLFCLTALLFVFKKRSTKQVSESHAKKD